MRQTRANYLHCQAQPEEWAFLSFWRKGNGRVMNWLVFVLFKIWKEVWWWWLQVSIAFRPFHLPVLSFFSPESVLNIFPVALGHALHNAGVLCRTWFHWISSAGWLGKAKINGLKSWRKKKKVWSERSKCEKITAPCKCGLVKSLAAKTEGSWKQLSPLVSNVFKFGFRNLSFWTSVTLPRRTLCNWHPDSRMWQPKQVRDCSRAAPCCGHP